MIFNMSKNFNSSTDSVWAIISNPNLTIEKYKSYGALSVDLTKFDIKDDISFINLVRKTNSLDNIVPNVLKKVLGAQQEIIQNSTWTRISPDEIEVDVEIIIKGKPITCNAKGKITTVEENICSYTLTYDVTSNFPLAGKLLCDFFKKETLKFSEFDYHFITKHLNQEG